jgi:hypothetical protein
MSCSTQSFGSPISIADVVYQPTGLATVEEQMIGWSTIGQLVLA